MTTTFVVDTTATTSTNTGSEANPFNSIDQAIAHDGPDTIMDWRDQTVDWPGTKTLTVGGSGVGTEAIWKSRNPGGCKWLWRNAAARGAFVHVNAGVDYRKFIDFEIDGNQWQSGLWFQTSAGAARHHYTFQRLFIHHCGGAGAETASMDYVQWLDNKVWLCGHRTDGTTTTASGYSLNAKGAPYIFGTYVGIHSIIDSNIIAGCEGPPSDGNGIILDNGGPTAAVATIGSTLVSNNIAYMKGNRGMQNLACTPMAGGDIIFANNLSWKNGLDQTTNTATNGFLSEFEQSRGFSTWINNVAVGMDVVAGTKFGTTPFRDGTPGSSQMESYTNYRVGGKTSAAWASTALTGGTLPIALADAGLTGPLPTIDTTQLRAHLLAPDPRSIGAIFKPTASSALRNAGTDPLGLASLSQQIRDDIAPWLSVDIDGNPRPR